MTASVSSRASSLRRRADNLLLRWQARLESEWSDRVLPWLLAGGLFLILVLLSLAKARSLDGTVDLAIYSQGTWLIRHGETPVSTLTTGSNLMASQAAFVFYAVSFLSFLLPIQTALLVVQSGALALATIPIWRIGRQLANLRSGAVLTLVVVYALYPAMHVLNLAGFHPETLALPALLFAAYFGLAKHWRRYVACCIFIVLCRADFGLAVAGLGALVWAEGRKAEGRVTMIGGLAYTAIAVLVVQPWLGDGTYAHIHAFAGFGDTPWSVVTGMVSHPGDVLGSLVREQNFNLVVTLFAPVAFLPLLAPRYLLPIIPLQFFFFVAPVNDATSIGPQTVGMTAFIFLATAFALSRVGRMGVERITVDRRLLAVMLLAATLFFVRDSSSSPYRHPWAWGGRDSADAARLSAADRVGPERSVRASSTVITVVAERRQVYVFPLRPSPDAGAAASGVEAIILDDRTVEWTAADHRLFTDGLESLGFTSVSTSEGIEVFIRNP